jgi:hypothetical protein
MPLVILTSTGIFKSSPDVVVILLLVILICPANNVLVTASAPPPDILLVKYSFIALSVGTILFELAANVCSLLNSLITTELPPNCTPPKLSSSRPDS